MTKREFKGRVIVNGQATAEAVVTHQGFNTLASFSSLGGADSGRIVNCSDAQNKELYGKQITDMALCLPQTIGSTTGGMILFNCGRLNQLPACMLFADTIDSLAASGAVLVKYWTDAKMPVIDQLGQEFLDYVKDGMTIKIYKDGVVEVSDDATEETAVQPEAARPELKEDEMIKKLVNTYVDWDASDYENHALGTGRFTDNFYPYEKMFSPIQINGMTIKNRTVMAPMGNCMMCDSTGRPTNKMIRYFEERAEGGIGLITTGLVPVSQGVDPTVLFNDGTAQMPRIDRDVTFSGWKDMAAGVHARNSRIFIQLTPGLGRVGPPMCALAGTLPVSASENPNFYMPAVPSRELTDEECDKIIAQTAQCAFNSKFVGMDGIYLHGHEGYLLDQMTNPAFNRRTEGKYTNYQAFGRAIVSAIRQAVGPKFPIMYRIDLSAALNETYEDRMDMVSSLKLFRNGRTIEQSLSFMENLVKAGVDMFDVDLGCYDNWWLPHPPATMPAGCYVDVSKKVKDYFAEKGIKSNAGYEVPVVAVGKLGYPDIAEQALRDGKCDMFMLGRPVLADPEWVNKAYRGDVKDIRPCIGCQEGCINGFVETGHITCAVNARTGFEDVYPKQVMKSQKSKRIAVVGGGPAGMNFSIYAAGRGHKIDLYEVDSKLGGELIAAGKPTIKFDVKNYKDWLVRQIKRCENITVHLNTNITNDMLKYKGYDTVVYANGAKECISAPIPGWGGIPSQLGSKLLKNPVLLPKDAKKIVVIGGGQVGCESAWWLKSEMGRDVTIIEMLPQFMYGACTANKGWLIHSMEERGIKMMASTVAKEIKDGRLVVSEDMNPNRPDGLCTWTPIVKNLPAAPLKQMPEDKVLEADFLVVAMGGKAEESMFLEGQKTSVAPEIYNIGDSYKMGRILEANNAAYAAAMNL